MYTCKVYDDYINIGGLFLYIDVKFSLISVRLRRWRESRNAHFFSFPRKLPNHGREMMLTNFAVVWSANTYNRGFYGFSFFLSLKVVLFLFEERERERAWPSRSKSPILTWVWWGSELLHWSYSVNSCLVSFDNY